MSSLQERLQLKRVPLDTWNIREQLCLASAVVRSGDQNWMSVSRAFKTVGEPNRPPDWYSQKSCAAQYGALLEHVETPKRKKRSSEGAVETPQESILKRLTQERIAEIQKSVADMTQQYEQLQKEIAEVSNPSTAEERVQELWAGIEAAKRARERESARRAAWLKEREERRARAERTWRPPQQQGSPVPVACPGSPLQPSSPLLTSLLKSSPVVTTPQHISHPANVVDTISPSAGAPTLSMLLEKPQGGGSPHESKHAAIEHIKSQLVQIEQQLKASTSVAAAPPPAPAVDIDDIEIKAEDVYAFRDIDIHIPPVTAMHKAAARIEKPVFKKEQVETPSELVETISDADIKVEPVAADAVEEIMETEIETSEEAVEELRQRQPEAARVLTPEAELTVSFPEVKFPTPEIKVIQPEDQEQVKEEIKEPEAPAPPEAEKEEEQQIVEEEPESVPEPVEEESTEQVAEPVEEAAKEVVETPAEEAAVEEEEVVEEKEKEEEEVAAPIPEEIPLPQEVKEEPAEVTAEETPPAVEETHEPPPKEEIVEEKEQEEEAKEPAEESEAEATTVEEKLIEDIKKDEDEDSIPLKEMMREGSMASAAAAAEAEAAAIKTERPIDTEDTHTETDDDTPMELSREEEKDGKKKRDYSRKKKSESRTCSGSESAAEASAPDSPSASDAERQHRLWRKSVMLVYSRLCAHKYASLFLRPISDEEAPGYSVVVKRPMDLTTIRRNIDAGLIRTTAEFQRDVLLMLSNALMYNSSEHSVYRMARDMHEEAQCQLGMLLAAQAHAGLVAAPPRRKRRAPTSTVRHQRPSSDLAAHQPKRHHH
ncbi:unnamed protein product, partial [Iphiclides podalirius]